MSGNLDPRRLIRSAGDNAWLLVAAAMFIWGANAPVVRAAVGEISPMVIVCLRWALVGIAIAIFTPKNFASDWRTMRGHPWMLLFMILVMTSSNALVFTAAKYTTGINLSILQGAAPVLVLIGARIAYAHPVGRIRAIGVALSLFGIVYLATRGAPSAIADLRLNIGDVYFLSAVALYSCYVLILRKRPAISNYSLFCLVAIGSFFASIPLLAWEYQAGQIIWPTLKGFLALIYVAFFTSMLGQIFFMRAVELMGPGRASQFQNLPPLIGAFLSVLFLGETFAAFHFWALVFILGGIVVAERFGPK